MIHELKTEAGPYHAVAREEKRAEFRRNDRNFQVSDILVLRQYDPMYGYSGAYLLRKITHIQEGFGMHKWYSMLSIRPLTPEEEANHAAGVITKNRAVQVGGL